MSKLIKARMIQPEQTVFHRKEFTIAVRATGEPETFYKAGTGIKATGVGAGKPINEMANPEGTVLVGASDVLTGLVAHDFETDIDGFAQVAVVISGEYYTQMLPVLPADEAVMTDVQKTALNEQGLKPYGVYVKPVK